MRKAELTVHTKSELPSNAVPVSTALLSDDVRNAISTRLGRDFYMVYAYENKVFVKMPNVEGKNSYLSVTGLFTNNG